jgi:hypothetical protein
MDVNDTMAKEIHRFGVCAKGYGMRVLPAYEKRAKKAAVCLRLFRKV